MEFEDSVGQVNVDDLIAQLPSPVPNDEDGFAHSFQVEQSEDIRNFFDTYGYVVVRDVLTEEEITSSRDEFFNQFSCNDDQSVTNFLNSFYNRFSRMGIIGIGNDLSSYTQLSNRQSESIYRAFVAVYGTERLIVDHDRWGAMRPTRAAMDSPVKKEWQTINNWLHLDCHPISGKISVGSFNTPPGSIHDFDSEAPFLVQGVLALSNAREQDGGFLCVPGSHRISKEWAFRNGWADRPFPGQIRPESDDPLQYCTHKIPVRAGSIIIWNQFTFHANHPNCSDQWRFNQYIRMYPVDGTRFQPFAPDVTLYPDGFLDRMTPLGKLLFGIEPWPDLTIDQSVASHTPQCSIM